MSRAIVKILIVWVVCWGCSAKYEIIQTRFNNGDIQFSANIYKPVGQDPFPAVVIIHGSKNHTKDFYTEYSSYFAENGIVVLKYENRRLSNGQRNFANAWETEF